MPLTCSIKVLKRYMRYNSSMPLYAPNSVASPVKSIERALTTGLGIHFAMNDKETIYKVHEDERGKFEVLAERSKHMCESELLEKGIGFEVPLKCFCVDCSLCKTVLLYSMSGQLYNACVLFPNTLKSETIQGNAIKVVLALKDCIELALFKMYLDSGQREYATSFHNKFLVGVAILWESCWRIMQKFFVFILEDKDDLKRGNCQ